MKINERYLIEKAASTDETRPQITNPYLTKRGKNNVLVATDGRMLAIVPVELEDEDKSTTGYIPVEALKKLRVKRYIGTMLHVEEKNVVVFQNNGSSTFKRDIDSTFVEWERVIPTKKADFEITLNPYMLLDLAKALGILKGESVTIKGRKDEKAPIEVKGYGDAYGVLMPMNKRKN